MTAAFETLNPIADQAGAQAAVLAYLSQNANGGWSVRDEADNRGGLFQNREAALKFVRREFGREARVVTAAPQLLN